MTTLPLQVRTLTTLDAIRALVPVWRDLLASSNSNEPTLAPEWLLSWWEVYGNQDGRRPCWLVVEEAGQLLGLAPLLTRRAWYRPGLPFRRLEPWGSGEADSEAVCSDYLNVLARQGREAEVARAVVASLVQNIPGKWDELVIPLMDGTGPMPNLLVEAARKAGLLAWQVETARAPYIPLAATWEDYLAQLNRKERYLINRSLRDFERWAGGPGDLMLADASTLDEGKRILRDLHHERWNGAGGGTFRSERFLAFHDRVMAALLAGGALELLWLNVRGKPISTIYNMVWNRKTYFYQCGRCVGLPRQVRAGGVLLYHAIRRSIEAGRREFDFLGGEALYKKQLALASRPLVQVRVARRGLVERARGLIEQSENWLRPLWHRIRGRKSSTAAKTSDETSEEG